MAVAKLSIFDLQRFLRIAKTCVVWVLLNDAFFNCRLDYLEAPFVPYKHTPPPVLYLKNTYIHTVYTRLPVVGSVVSPPHWACCIFVVIQA